MSVAVVPSGGRARLMGLGVVGIVFMPGVRIGTLYVGAWIRGRRSRNRRGDVRARAPVVFGVVIV